MVPVALVQLPVSNVSATYTGETLEHFLLVPVMSQVVEVMVVDLSLNGVAQTSVAVAVPFLSVVNVATTP
jgi:hypothetical protein